MSHSTKLFLFGIIFLFSGTINAQSDNQHILSGNLQLTGNFFIRDSIIDADKTPQYDHQLYGAESWLQLNYSGFGFDVGVRFDAFHNSNLLNRQDSYSAQGIGRWYIKKKIKELGISAGFLYDQIGSGIIFRAFEDRTLLIDNALTGLRLTYDLGENWTAKAFTGRQKRQFELYPAIIKGAAIDGFIAPKDLEEGKTNWSLAPGFGIVNRTIDDATMGQVTGALSSYLQQDSITPKYNNYAISLYNTLTYGDFSWYVEGALKSKDVIFNPFLTRTNQLGQTVLGKLVSETGSVVYTSLSFSKKGFGANVEYKRTENFTLRTDPFAVLTQGQINFLPPMSRVNTYRLTARYAPATQELGEQAFQIDLRYNPTRKLGFNVNFSNITRLDGELLYREAYTEVVYKYKRKWNLTGGIQFQNYNQDIFENKPGVPLVEALTPYAEFLYKFDRKKSLRTEFQYMNTDEDFGSWVFALAEFSVAPNWIFTLSDMYNLDDKKTAPHHYPRVDVTYIRNANRFGLSFIKQVEGIVCTGGICRLEPAFSGVRLNVSSTF